MNVYCTQYEIVRKAAKVFRGFIIRERAEDHEGGVTKHVGG